MQPTRGNRCPARVLSLPGTMLMCTRALPGEQGDRIGRWVQRHRTTATPNFTDARGLGRVPLESQPLTECVAVSCVPLHSLDCLLLAVRQARHASWPCKPRRTGHMQESRNGSQGRVRQGAPVNSEACEIQAVHSKSAGFRRFRGPSCLLACRPASAKGCAEEPARCGGATDFRKPPPPGEAEACRWRNAGAGAAA